MTRVAMIVLHDMSWDRRVDREASALAAAGHEVSVFCFRSEGLPEREMRNGFTIRRSVPWYTDSWRHPVRKVAMSRLRKAAFIDAVVEHAPTVIHCHDLPALQYGVVAAARVGARVVYDDHELFPDSLVQRSHPAVVAYWRSVERRCVPRADAVITVSPGIASILRERYGKDVRVVLNVPEEVLPECEGSPLRERLGLESDTPIVLYQGLLLAKGRALDALVDAMGRLPEDAVLVVQGSGEGEPAMRRRVAEAGLSSRVHFMGWIPPEDLYTFTCGATAGTVFLDGLERSHQHSLPNRLFLFMMAGVAPVVSDLPDMAAFVAETGIGVTAAPRDPSSMAEAIRWLIEHPKEREAMTLRARELAVDRYNWPKESERLIGVYRDLLEDDRGALPR